MKVWILTTEYNEYDQYGEYFIAVFSQLPSVRDLASFTIPADQCEHVRKGGGRIAAEQQWWFLREHKI